MAAFFHLTDIKLIAIQSISVNPFTFIQDYEIGTLLSEHAVRLSLTIQTGKENNTAILSHYLKNLHRFYFLYFYRIIMLRYHEKRLSENNYPFHNLNPSL